MAYEGYRIKVNDVVIHDSMIAKGSYSLRKASRVIASYYDAAGVLHEERSPHVRVAIKFSIRQRNMFDHEKVMAAFLMRENVTVNYWDDEESIYKTAICKIGDLNIAHLNTIAGVINYAELPISIEEY